LSGTVSYVLRTVYNFFFGITFEYDGLFIRGSMPAEFGDASVDFEYLGKKLTIKYTKTDCENKKVLVNGKAWTKTKVVNETGRVVPFMADSDMLDNNLIEIDY
jgi:cellobiose phosphorylase